MFTYAERHDRVSKNPVRLVKKPSSRRKRAVVCLAPSAVELARAILLGKFAGVLGRILAELAQRGETAYPIEAFRADRPAITDPNFPRQFRLTVPVATT